ncbi:MAG: hypothetical protein MI717_04250 [Spirochaetales bacterium]|nr:hypothetical protein [Spirochaetales bacterium]
MFDRPFFGLLILSFLFTVFSACKNPLASTPTEPPFTGEYNEVGTNLRISTALIDFGTRLPLGYDYDTRVLRVQNISDKTINISSAFTGEGRGQFRQERTFPSQIAPRATVNFRILFQPPREGKKVLNVTLRILEQNTLAVTEIPLVGRTSAGIPDQDIIYVNLNATGEDDGTSWENAFTSITYVANLLDQYQAKDKEIWVAKGRYILNKGVGIQYPNKYYGGFNGHEDQLEDRNPSVNATILDGNEQATHVLRIVPQFISDRVERDLIFDGFDITGGRALGTSIISGNNAGGGIFIGRYRLRDTARFTRVIINNCRIYGNTSLIAGAAIWNGHEPFVLSNTLITGNTGGVSGGNGIDREIDRVLGTSHSRGSILSLGGSSAKITQGTSIINCTIAGNIQGERAQGYDDPNRIISDSLIQNTIIYGSYDGLDLLGDEKVNLSHSILNALPQEEQFALPSAMSTVTVEDPLFTGINDADFSTRTANVASGSPAINAGKNEAVQPWMTKSLNHADRIIASNVDIGAFEALSP